MKLFIVSLFLPCLLAAQQNTVANRQQLVDVIKGIEQKPSIASYNQIELPLADDILSKRVGDYVVKHHHLLKQSTTGLLLTYNNRSRVGSHLMFQQTYLGIPILGATLKINVNNQNVIISSFDNLVSTQNWMEQKFVPNVNLGNAFWIAIQNEIIPVYQKWDQDNYVITDKSGIVLYQKDAHLYATDTLVLGKVFLPDPLTPLGVVSGQDGTYLHFNDSDYSLLNDQRVLVMFPAKFDSGVFRLSNSFVKVEDFIAPNIAPATSVSGRFDFLRGEDAFKDVMCAYHITNLQQYLFSLNITNVNFPIRVDAHATTFDNSSFLPTDTTLRLGTGGVPDAEDADVITHEFTHALSFMITPSVNMSPERRAIEEGLCDVQAALYSKRYATFNWRKLFNWDGPNPTAVGTSPFWSGRNGASSKTYANYSGSPYPDSEIWSSTLLDISEQIGGDSTLVLLFASLASYTDNTTMPQAAQLFMQADSILTNKTYGWKIGPVFKARGMGNFPTALNEFKQSHLDRLTIKNSLDFALGSSNAEIDLPIDANITIVNMQGQIISQFDAPVGITSFKPEQFSSGVFFVQIQAGYSFKSFKLVKF